MDARFMQMYNLVLAREVIINSMFPVDRMRELNFHRETAVYLKASCSTTEVSFNVLLSQYMSFDLYLTNREVVTVLCSVVKHAGSG